MSEERRLKIAKRQLMLAQIARREARLALANAVAEEERSAQIHARSRGLLHEYAKRALQTGPASESYTLQANLGFLRSLRTVVDNAQVAHKDASDQAEWQIRSLAAAEAKMNAHETRVGEEARALCDLRLRRELPAGLTGVSGMARKLHNGGHFGQKAARKGSR